MKVISAVELADDEKQGPVKIVPQTLKRVEQYVDKTLPERSLNPVVHHFLVGGLAYLSSAPISGMSVKEVQKFYSEHASIIRMFAKGLTKSMEKPE